MNKFTELKSSVLHRVDVEHAIFSHKLNINNNKVRSRKLLNVIFKQVEWNQISSWWLLMLLLVTLCVLAKPINIPNLDVTSGSRALI